MKSLLYEACRWLAAAVLVYFLIASGADNQISTAKPDDVLDAVCAQANMTQMQKADNQMIKRLYRINPSDYEACILYYPATNMDVDEILLVKLSDISQAEILSAAAQSRLEQQITSFENYGAEQTDLLKNHSVLETRGNYFIFVVSPDAQAVRTAFICAL